MTIEFRPSKKQFQAWELLTDNTTTELGYGGAAHGGKAQALDSKVLTPFGWRDMGSLKVGSYVLNPEGEQQQVIAIHPQGEKDLYKVKFSDGSETKCTGDHLWKVRKAKKKRKTRVDWRIQTTLQVKEYLENGSYNLVIPLSEALPFCKTYKVNQIKIEPYTLGVLLGDGCFCGNKLSFTTEDDEIANNVRKDGYELNQVNKLEYSIINTDLRNVLRSWGLYNKKSEEKFVPKCYKWSSIKNRKEILKGLLDTDGTVDKEKGNISFTTVSKQLRDDIVFLVKSLGGRASWSSKKTNGQLAYNVYLYTPFAPFKLTRKTERCKTKSKDLRIISVEYCGKEEAQCITVDNPNGLYITDDFIVTHNSYLGCFFIISHCLAYPDTAWVIGRKELTNLKKTTLLTFYKVAKEYEVTGFRLDQQQNIIHFDNGSQVFLMDLSYQPSDPLYSRLGGLEPTGAFVDESNEIPFEAIDILKTRLGRRKNKEYGLTPKLLETFNPAKNHVYQRFYKPWKENTLPNHRQFIVALPSDNPYTTEDYLNQLRNADKVTRERLLKGNFEYEDDPNALLDYDSISDLFYNTVDKSGEKYLTADIARYGQDKTVIYLWQDFQIYKVIVYEKQSLQVTADKIRDIARDERIPFSHIVIDEDGVGGGVVDILQGVKGFVANSSPLETVDAPQNMVLKNGKPYWLKEKENFRNLKAQCGYHLADKINSRKIAVKNVDDKTKNLIIEDLEQLKAKDIEKEGKLQLMPKEEIKENIGRSPDYMDAMLMRMYLNLNQTAIVNNQFIKQMDYNEQSYVENPYE